MITAIRINPGCTVQEATNLEFGLPDACLSLTLDRK